MILKSAFNQNGFTLMEILMVILLVGILSYVSISTIGDSLQEGRFDQTVAEMKSLRQALVGDAEIKEAGVRQHFGYAGDIGALPSNAQGLQALLTNPGVPAYGVDADVRFGLGWSGPYMTADLGGDALIDGWGRSYSFNFSLNPATITSLGADGANGGSGLDQDITVTIPQRDYLGEVHGFISDNGAPYSGDAEVEINYPDGAGALTTSSVTVGPADQGHFVFTNIPLGHRSATVYIPDKASATRTFGPLLFTVDKADYVIASSSTNFAITGSGSGGGGGGGGGGVVCDAGIITYVAGSGSAGGPGKTRITFNINAGQSVTVNGLKFAATVRDPQLQSIEIADLQRACSDINPCPLVEETEGAITSGLPVNSGNGQSVRVEFDTNMQAETNLTLTFYYDDGCDTVGVNDL